MVVHPLFRRPLATAVALGVVAYASGLAGALGASAWRNAVAPVPGPLSEVHSLWAALQQDGSPLPPASPVPATASGTATASATAAGPSSTPSATPAPSVVTVAPATPIPAAPPVTVTVLLDGVPQHVYDSVTFSFPWQHTGTSNLSVSWTGVSAICLRVTASVSGRPPETLDTHPCPTKSPFAVAVGAKGAAGDFSVSGSPLP